MYEVFVPLIILMGVLVTICGLAGGKKDRYPKDAIPN